MLRTSGSSRGTPPRRRNRRAPLAPPGLPGPRPPPGSGALGAGPDGRRMVPGGGHGSKHPPPPAPKARNPTATPRAPGTGQRRRLGPAPGRRQGRGGRRGSGRCGIPTGNPPRDGCPHCHPPDPSLSPCAPHGKGFPHPRGGSPSGNLPRGTPPTLSRDPSPRDAAPRGPDAGWGQRTAPPPPVLQPGRAAPSTELGGSSSIPTPGSIPSPRFAPPSSRRSTPKVLLYVRSLTPGCRHTAQHTAQHTALSSLSDCTAPVRAAGANSPSPP